MSRFKKSSVIAGCLLFFLSACSQQQVMRNTARVAKMPVEAAGAVATSTGRYVGGKVGGAVAGHTGRSVGRFAGQSAARQAIP